MPDPETSALAVYWRFFEGTTRRPMNKGAVPDRAIPSHARLTSP